MQLDRPKTLCVREDRLVEQIRAQPTLHIGVEPADIGPIGLAALRRGNNITIVCTLVGSILDAAGNSRLAQGADRGR